MFLPLFLFSITSIHVGECSCKPLVNCRDFWYAHFSMSRPKSQRESLYYATSKYNQAGGIGQSVNIQHPHSPPMPSMHLKSATTYHVQHQLDIRYLPWLCDFGHLMSAVTFTMHCLSNACTVASVVFCILSFFPLPSITASPLLLPATPERDAE